MVKDRFPLSAVAASFFLLRKAKRRIFFTVKHIFVKIKLWPVRAGLIERGKDGFQHEEA